MAIKLLKQIELEKRTATPEEQIILARYVGWGGLANAFSSTASGWENEYQELKSLLTDVEYKAAMNSTITAYYTEPDLIRHIYRALERFGFEGGPDRKILDPGMGTGNFYSVLPEQFQESKLFGVELDSITGRIAKQLYPDADISIMGYEATKFEDNSFDGILGNIPFNSVKIYDRRYNDLNPYIHDYFFIKSLDLAKPGGIIAFITSKGIMDRKDESLREYIARRAEFIGAIRLPNTAFKALAGTDVTADVVFLKKRAHPIELPIKAVAYDCANSEGFDAVLTKKSWGDKPENYVKVAKNQDAKTITFTNVKNGTYYLGIHAYNRDYYDGKVSGKRFGAWSYPVKVVVKNGIPTERVKIKTVKTSKGAVSVTVGVPKGFARADMELRSTGGTTVYKRNNRTTYTRITGVKPGTYTLKVRPWVKINGRKAYGDWVSWGRRIRVK